MPETTALSLQETTANVRLSRSARNEWQVDVPAGTEPESLLEPGYWKHIATRFKKGDDIVAVCVDRTWRATYEIRDIGPHYMVLAIVKHGVDGVCRYGGAQVTQEGNLQVSWIAPGSKWGVRRSSDNEIIRSKFETRESAEAWLAGHLRDMAA